VMNMSKKYFFVDESGDSTFFDRKGTLIVGNEGCSKVLILGFICTDNPKALRRSVAELREEVINDEYLKTIPSMSKTAQHFHAKDDCPEVREKVFKRIKSLDFKAQFIVARKRLDIFQKRHKKNEHIFYNEIVSRLFEKSLHKNQNVIYFSKRGSQTKQSHFLDAIQTALLNFEAKYGIQADSYPEVFVQTPKEENLLQVIDYMSWAVFRAFSLRDVRYLNFVRDKISLLVDIYDFDKYPKNFYDKRNVFDINKISPL